MRKIAKCYMEEELNRPLIRPQESIFPSSTSYILHRSEMQKDALNQHSWILSVVCSINILQKTDK